MMLVLLKNQRPTRLPPFLTLTVIVDDVFRQEVVVAKDSGRVELRQVRLQRLHLRRQSVDAGKPAEFCGTAARGRRHSLI